MRANNFGRSGWHIGCYIIVALAIAGCSGPGVGSVPPGQPLAQSAPADQVQAPQKRSLLVFSPSALTLFGTGKANTGRVVVSELGYSGRFTQSGDCAKIASIATTSRKGPAFTLTAIPRHEGSCFLVFEDAHHRSARLRVTDQKVAGRVKFAIDVPQKSGNARHVGGRRRSPSYISPYTQAITITTTSGPTLETVTLGLNSIAGDCTQQFGELECTITVDLQPCPTSGACYSADITAYDAFDETTNAIPPGAAALSLAKNITFGVNASQTSGLTFALSGIPASLVVTPADSTSTVQQGSITLTGLGSHPFFANAYDADGNPIVGSGAPIFTLAASPAPGLTLNTPPPGSPRFSITPPETVADYAQVVKLTVGATFPSGETDGCSVPGATCQAQYLVGVPAPITEYTVATTNADISHITTGPDGNLWFTESKTNAIGKITTSGVVTTYPGLTGPANGITTGPDGNLWFTEPSTTRIGRMSTSGVIAEFSLPPVGEIGGNYPLAITPGPDGNLWFTACAAVGNITTSGLLTEYSLDARGYYAPPPAITTGPDGNLWFSANPLIANITTTGTLTYYTGGLPSGSDFGVYSLANAHGNLWFAGPLGIGTITTTGIVTTYATGSTGTNGITLGSDGNVWVSNNWISRVTAAGSITIFPVIGDGPGSVASGPDGNIWFTQPSTIGKLRLH